MSDFSPSPSPSAPRYFSHLLLHPSLPLCTLLFLASSLSWWSGTCMCSGVQYRPWRTNISGLCISNIEKDLFYRSRLPTLSFSCLLSWVIQMVKEVFGHWCLILQISGIEIIIMEIISSIFNVYADKFTLKLYVMNEFFGVCLFDAKINLPCVTHEWNLLLDWPKLKWLRVQVPWWSCHRQEACPVDICGLGSVR